VPRAVGGSSLLFGMAVVAGNLRPAAASVGPVVDGIRDSLGISSTAASMLLALPVVCFGAAAVLAPALARRLGHGRSIGAALVVLVAGLVLRVAGGVPALFAGTLLAGAAIAVANVLLPVLVKRSFPERTGFATTVYMGSLTGVSALAAALTVPIEHGLGGGWQVGLGIWAVPAAIALLVWLPQLREQPPSLAVPAPDADAATDAAAPAAVAAAAPPPRIAPRDLLADPIARRLVLFFGLQAGSFYAMLSWLPSIFKAHGLSSTSAGVLLGVSMFMGLPAAMVIPGLATRARDQRWFPIGLCSLTALGFLGLIFVPATLPLLWAVLIGLGQGACFPLAMTLIVLRSGALAVTTSLSTLVQGCGYLIAACGPLLLGVVHDVTGSWSVAVALLAMLLVPQVLAGAGAGRAVRIEAPE
jgi:CP family cyanate transporter-like MFS transporter